jgi:hypothetical protein
LWWTRNGSALQALTADANTRLVALGDVFPDQLERSVANLKKTPAGDRVENHGQDVGLYRPDHHLGAG